MNKKLLLVLGIIGIVVIIGINEDNKRKERVSEALQSWPKQNHFANGYGVSYSPTTNTYNSGSDDYLRPTPQSECVFTCDDCLGTGVVPYSSAHVLPSMNYNCKDCSLAKDSYAYPNHVCHIEQCYRCHQSHCTSSNIHVKCERCDGIGKTKILFYISAG